MREDIAKALRNLTPATDTAKLREIFSEVDAALKNGVSREVVWEALKEKGFTFTLNSFNSAVTRLRKEQSAKQTESGQGVAVVPATPKIGLSIGEEASGSPKQDENQFSRSGVSEFQQKLEAPVKTQSYKAILAQQQKEDKK